MLLKNESSALGNVRRMVLDKMNNYSYMVEHGNGLASCDVAFDGIQNEVITSGNGALSNYFAVDWFLGEESTSPQTLEATEKTAIKNYLNGGGRLLISGAEIGWDLGRTASANADTSFYKNYLKAVYVSDDAGTYNFNGTTGFFNGGSGTFGNGVNGYYDVDYADVLGTTGGSELVLNYGTGTAAGVGYKGQFRVLYFGFPIEAIINDNVRNNLICESVGYLAEADTTSLFVLTGKQVRSGNKLQWTTGPETNIANYRLERSTDGKYFKAVTGPIKPMGSAGEGYQYDVDDNDVTSTAYYRVVTTDKNNKQTVSNLAIIQNEQQQKLFVLNNPAQGDIRLRIQGTGSFRLTLLNAAGQTVYQTNVNAVNNRHVVIPASKLTKGIYWLSANGNNQKMESVKILIQ
jgi:hypothetical protein